MASEKRPNTAVTCLLPTQSESQVAIVDFKACQRVAAWLKSHTIPTDREEGSIHWLSHKEIGNFYLLLVAICHQTTPRDRPPLEGTVGERYLRGWDYLSAKLETAVRSNFDLLSPEVWARTTPEDVRRIFRDDTRGDRLTDPAGRASLIRDLGVKLQERSWNWTDQIYNAAEHRIATGSPNLLDLLAQFRAYNDPVQKKSYLFLALMQNTGVWVYADADQLGAPVDYHEVRGHLRIGTLKICDPDLRTKLIKGWEITREQDVRIRQAVLDALKLISAQSGLRNSSQLHYMFWNVFRSCCTREAPHCSRCPADCSLPVRYVPLALFPSGARRCPFSEICQSAGRFPKLQEPNVSTDYY